jgi:putative ABC transport system permease protein
MSPRRSPLIPRLLVDLLLRGGEREVIAGDLEEEYRCLANGSRGSRYARRWYWRQALRAVGGRWLVRIRRMAGVGDSRGTPGVPPAPGQKSPIHGRMRRVGDMLREVGQDIRFGLRSLRRRPTFTVVAGLTLALGIGANTAMFSVLDAVLLRPLGYPDADRIVQVWSGRPLAKSTLEEIERSVSSFAVVTGYGERQLALTGVGDAMALTGAAVSPSHFDVMGVQPWLGRTFAQEEAEPGRDAVTILGHDLWVGRFSSDPDILGRSVMLDGAPRTVVGVMPVGYRPVSRAWSIWVPLTVDRTNFSDYEGTAGTTVLGRLARGASTQQANAELEPIARALQETAPQVFTEEFVVAATAVPFLDAAVEPVRRTLWLLLSAVGLVLLVACANVANLLLAQGGSRAREMAVRRSLGASGGRLVRQLLTESAILGLAGGTLGLLAARLLLGGLRYHLASGVPRGDTVGVDYRVLAFALLVSFLTAMVFGLVPAMKTAGRDVQSSLCDGGRGGTPRGARRGMNRALVAVEVAISVVLLVGAGLLLKSSWILQRVDPGFRSEGVLTLHLHPPEGRYAEARAREEYYRQVEERTAALPGVTARGSITYLPMTARRISTMYTVKDRPLPEGTPQPFAMAQFVTPGLLGALQIPLLRGRWFDGSDRPEGPRVGVINESLAVEAFGSDDPIGQEMEMFGNVAFTVVGVIGDIREVRWDREAVAETFFSFYQFPMASSLFLAVRTSGDPKEMVTGVLEAIQSVDIDVPISRIATMDEVLRATTYDSRLTTLLFSLFAGIALLLGTVGVYGVIAHTVSSRTYEIGVRMALGAHRDTVVREVMGRALLPAGVGLALGLASALGVTRVVEGLLFEVQPRDPAVFLVVTAALTGAVLVASFTPARRAASIDPARCLNAE